MRRFVSMDPFCFRQFEDPLKLSFVSADKEAFVARVNEYIAANGGEACLRDGYAPFCKHIFMPNDATFTQARATTVRLVPELEPAVRTAYEARTAKELPVLVRFLPRAAMPAPGPPVATFLDVILYNRAQLDKENAAMHGAKQKQQQQQQQQQVSKALCQPGPTRPRCRRRGSRPGRRRRRRPRGSGRRGPAGFPRGR